MFYWWCWRVEIFQSLWLQKQKSNWTRLCTPLSITSASMQVACWLGTIMQRWVPQTHYIFWHDTMSIVKGYIMLFTNVQWIKNCKQLTFKYSQTKLLQNFKTWKYSGTKLLQNLSLDIFMSYQAKLWSYRQ